MDKEDTLVNKLPCGVKEVSPDMRPALVAFRYNVIKSSNYTKTAMFNEKIISFLFVMKNISRMILFQDSVNW